MEQLIIEKLKTVYDPEFPLVDIFTMGLIYAIKIDETEKTTQNMRGAVWNYGKVWIIMTFTTPTCPMADLMIEMVKNAVLEVVPSRQVEVEITFDPMRTPEMIRDEDLKRMFL